MAGERSENLEELVRRIVHSVNRNETSHSNDNGSTSNSVQNRASTVEEELNERFLIPRGAHSNDSTRAQDVAAQFNPNNNYGYTNYRSRQPSRQRNSQGNEHQHYALATHEGVHANDQRRFLP